MEEKSGIGGRMVRTARNKATKAGRRAGRAENCDGAGQITEFAGTGLKEESETVMAQLAEAVLSGNPRGFEKWMDLSTNAPRGEEQASSPNGFSQALAWKAEPEWQGESNEEDGETAGGSREPESQFD